MSSFLEGLIGILNEVILTQREVLDRVGTRMAQTLAQGGLVHLYGSGHSVLPTQDAFPRYGSYIGLNPLNDPRLMWHNILGPGGVRELLWLERTEGYAERYLSHEPLRAGDVLIVFSHGGRNAAPLEAARYGKAKGLWVVAVTSGHTIGLSRPHSSGRHLSEVADAFVDTRVPVQDALVEVEGWDRPVGGSSTIVAMALVQELVVRAAQRLAQQGMRLPTFVSPTVKGATVASNDEVFAAYEKLMAEVKSDWLKRRE